MTGRVPVSFEDVAFHYDDNSFLKADIYAPCVFDLKKSSLKSSLKLL